MCLCRRALRGVDDGHFATAAGAGEVVKKREREGKQGMDIYKREKVKRAVEIRRANDRTPRGE